MRTTLDIDEDVLAAAKELAAVHKSTAGKVLSELARSALRPSGREQLKNGVPLLPPRRNANFVTQDVVRRLLEDEP